MGLFTPHKTKLFTDRRVLENSLATEWSFNALNTSIAKGRDRRLVSKCTFTFNGKKDVACGFRLTTRRSVDDDTFSRHNDTHVGRHGVSGTSAAHIAHAANLVLKTVYIVQVSKMRVVLLMYSTVH